MENDWSTKLENSFPLPGGGTGGEESCVQLPLLRGEGEDVGLSFCLLLLVKTDKSAADIPVLIFHVTVVFSYVQGYEHHEHEEADGRKHPVGHRGNCFHQGLCKFHGLIQLLLRFTEFHTECFWFQSWWNLQLGVKVHYSQVCYPFSMCPIHFNMLT